jgi:hypothetical protein
MIEVSILSALAKTVFKNTDDKAKDYDEAAFLVS